PLLFQLGQADDLARQAQEGGYPPDLRIDRVKQDHRRHRPLFEGLQPRPRVPVGLRGLSQQLAYHRAPPTGEKKRERVSSLAVGRMSQVRTSGCRILSGLRARRNKKETPAGADSAPARVDYRP